MADNPRGGMSFGGSVAELFATLGLDASRFDEGLKQAEVKMQMSADAMLRPVQTIQNLLKQLETQAGPRAAAEAFRQLETRVQAATDALLRQESVLLRGGAALPGGLAQRAATIAAQQDVFASTLRGAQAYTPPNLLVMGGTGGVSAARMAQIAASSPPGLAMSFAPPPPPPVRMPPGFLGGGTGGGGRRFPSLPQLALPTAGSTYGSFAMRHMLLYGAIFGGLGAAHEALELPVDIMRQAEQTGMGLDDTQSLKAAAMRTHTPIELVASSIARMQERVASGNTQALGTLEKLKLSAKAVGEAFDRDAASGVRMLVKAIEGLRTESEKVTAFQGLTGGRSARAFFTLQEFSRGVAPEGLTKAEIAAVVDLTQKWELAKLKAMAYFDSIIARVGVGAGLSNQGVSGASILSALGFGVGGVLGGFAGFAGGGPPGAIAGAVGGAWSGEQIGTQLGLLGRRLPSPRDVLNAAFMNRGTTVGGPGNLPPVGRPDLSGLMPSAIPSGPSMDPLNKIGNAQWGLVNEAAQSLTRTAKELSSDERERRRILDEFAPEKLRNLNRLAADRDMAMDLARTPAERRQIEQGYRRRVGEEFQAQRESDLDKTIQLLSVFGVEGAASAQRVRMEWDKLNQAFNEGRVSLQEMKQATSSYYDLLDEQAAKPGLAMALSMYRHGLMSGEDLLRARGRMSAMRDRSSVEAAFMRGEVGLRELDRANFQYGQDLRWNQDSSQWFTPYYGGTPTPRALPSTPRSPIYFQAPQASNGSGATVNVVALDQFSESWLTRLRSQGLLI